MSELQFAAAKAAFQQHSGHPLAEEPLELWVLPSDRHLPSTLIGLPLRHILSTPYSHLAQTRGVGQSKLDKLVSLLERAVNHLKVSTNDSNSFPDSVNSIPNSGPKVETSSTLDGLAGNVTTPPETFDLETLDEGTWTLICNRIKSHGLAQYPIGRFAASLDDLPRGLWAQPLEIFVSKSLFELNQLPGYGEQRIGCVMKVILFLAGVVSNCPTHSHLRFQVYPVSINGITSWINRILRQEEVPDHISLCQHFVLPLLRQLEIDLGSQVAEMVERRLGVDGNPETLQQVAEHFELTRERIRQLTSRAPQVMQIRWPEGKHLLDDFYDKFRSSSNADEHIELIHRTMDMLFAFQPDSGASRESVVEAWETAGRRKETPMSENEIFHWLGGNFPQLAPETAMKWIIQESQTCEFNGRLLYFSNDELDRLLYELYVTGSSTALSELADIDEKSERNLRSRILRDSRFTEDEDHYLLPTEMFGFVRDSVGWHVDLFAADGHKRPLRTVTSIDALVTLAVGGLLQLGIVDVTAWGFHRYVNEQLANLFHAHLPARITPFVLADMVVRQAGGRIRTMRRRRLRWDDESRVLVARGKRGWIGYVVEQQGVPIVLDEIGGLLKKYYQDYAPYVLNQLNLDSDEEGDSGYGAILVSGVAHKVPQMLVPSGWEFDPVKENVSHEVKLAVARAIGMVQDGSIAKHDLQHVPWFLYMVERHSYGEDIWEAPTQRKSTSFKTEKSLVQVRVSSDDPDSTAPRSNANGNDNKDVDELLSRFL